MRDFSSIKRIAICCRVRSFAEIRFRKGEANLPVCRDSPQGVGHLFGNCFWRSLVRNGILPGRGIRQTEADPARDYRQSAEINFDRGQDSRTVK